MARRAHAASRSSPHLRATRAPARRAGPLLAAGAGLVRWASPCGRSCAGSADVHVHAPRTPCEPACSPRRGALGDSPGGAGPLLGTGQERGRDAGPAPTAESDAPWRRQTRGQGGKTALPRRRPPRSPAGAGPARLAGVEPRPPPEEPEQDGDDHPGPRHADAARAGRRTTRRRRHGARGRAGRARRRSGQGPDHSRVPTTRPSCAGEQSCSRERGGTRVRPRAPAEHACSPRRG